MVVAFDNNQILHRQWNVKMVAIFQIDPAGQLQSSVESNPGNWTHQTSEKYKKCIDEIPDIKNTHYRQHLYPFLTDDTMCGKRTGK